MVVGCCDSRVSPEVIFDAEPGELFVVRNIANLVPIYQPDASAHGISAALEFGVEVLKVKHRNPRSRAMRRHQRHHQQGRAAVVRRLHRPVDGNAHQARRARRAARAGDDERLRYRIEKAAVFRSIDNLMTFPFVQKSVESGHLRLHGAYFGIAEGSLYALDLETKEFRSVGDNSLV